ncbi:enolase-phosphatase E1 [Dimargaris cristalligena]|uniref:2,3-diketo-5-methylthio-1-phosphopentane phosphatase n=1 Tax=Dimargaris cristalligena TaxID=215637 RepID=A0A4P9ZVA8_9FUNG|nr:enolase-phosphatase E1 [Dimargaris cristalligena]RKP37517.1 2,3-diketo-5-methylthio-1-phosphopentane phosphatase [Dimargaris cristalligena]|eukprot:RKP37517.1 2,3-diketo-5-methylthio-1-phosphopentane phosphatase [Dimargaris cristalligena]
MAPQLDYDAVLLDIEGTTTPISFVHDVLFPYVLDNAQKFLETRWASDELQPYLEGLKIQADLDREQGLAQTPSIPDLKSDSVSKEDKIEAIIANIRFQVSIDRKIKALKDFQGYMWNVGYADGELKSIMYDDVIDAMQRWKELGKPVYIYSSGSIAAQKLLFRYTNKGDLTPGLQGYYDTTSGSKLSPESYAAITTDMGFAPSRVLFVTDNPKEVQAARSAGLQTAASVRPGNPALPAEMTDDPQQLIIQSFASLF